MYGFVNVTLLLLLITSLVALFAIQLLQGDMDEKAPSNFGQPFNFFLAMYQILSGEAWTTMLYDANGGELRLGQAVVVCIFLCCWLLFSNCRFFHTSSLNMIRFLLAMGRARLVPSILQFCLAIDTVW